MPLLERRPEVSGRNPRTYAQSVSDADVGKVCGQTITSNSKGTSPVSIGYEANSDSTRARLRAHRGSGLLEAGSRTRTTRHDDMSSSFVSAALVESDVNYHSNSVFSPPAPFGGLRATTARAVGGCLDIRLIKSNHIIQDEYYELRNRNNKRHRDLSRPKAKDLLQINGCQLDIPVKQRQVDSDIASRRKSYLYMYISGLIKTSSNIS